MGAGLGLSDPADGIGPLFSPSPSYTAELQRNDFEAQPAFAASSPAAVAAPETATSETYRTEHGDEFEAAFHGWFDREVATAS